jgi:hypothetical protein
LEETKKGFFPAEKLNEKGTFVPMSLMAITRKAMSHSPSDRFAKVTDLREELERYLNGYPTEAEHAGAFRRSYLFYNRHQKVMLTILGASLMLVASLCVYIIKLSESERKAWEAMGVAEESKLEAIRSKDLAQTMQRQAEIAQQKAQQNLDRFIRELNKSRFNIMDSFMMSQPELTLRLAESRLRDLISHGPREKFTWGDRGDLNFFKNDFESAYHDYITCGEDWVQNRIEIIENEGLMTHTGPLSFSKKLSLIKALSVEKTFRSRYLALDVSKKRDLQKHGQLVEAALRSDNALWKGEFIYRPEPGYLELSGRLLKSLKSGQICTLVTLPLTELSLVRTSIDVLSLKSLNIRTLKLVGHSQQKSNGIMRLPHLSKLILKDHKIDDQTLNKMRDKGIAITEL